MAEESKRSYPLMPVRHWWSLREQFKRSIPSRIDESYLASVLDMSERSARNNILPSLRTIGLVADDRKPSNRAVRWRDDHHYAEVCEEIRDEVYPDQLLDVAPTPDDRPAAERWFATTTGAGRSAVQKMASLYATIVEADPSKSVTAPPPTPRQKTKPAKQSAMATNDEDKKPPPPRQRDNSPQTPQKRPEFHLNVQIHISADASANQIERIFESMARHMTPFLK